MLRFSDWPDISAGPPTHGGGKCRNFLQPNTGRTFHRPGGGAVSLDTPRASPYNRLVCPPGPPAGISSGMRGNRRNPAPEEKR